MAQHDTPRTYDQIPTNAQGHSVMPSGVAPYLFPTCPCGEPLLHEHGAAFYVSVYDPEWNRGKGRVGLLVGPFTTHAEALRWVEPARRKAEDVNDRALWYAFGTLAMRDGYNKPGQLNDLLAL